MAFDVGMLLANFWMSFFSLSAATRRTATARRCATICSASSRSGRSSAQEFAHLWRTERNGMLYPAACSRIAATRSAPSRRWMASRTSIWVDLLGFAGVEIHRRILGLAHNADFETIEDEDLRADCERPALRFGRQLAVNRARLHSIEEVNALARLINAEHFA
jgi:5-methylthioribose kinase